jgi:hypothetical protein
MPTKQTLPDVTINLTGTVVTSPALNVPAGYRRVDVAIISSTPAWSTLQVSDTLTLGVQYFDGAAWRFLFGNDATYSRVALPGGRVDRHGAAPAFGGGPFPVVDGKQVRVYGKTNGAALTLVVRVSIQ